MLRSTHKENIPPAKALTSCKANKKKSVLRTFHHMQNKTNLQSRKLYVFHVACISVSISWCLVPDRNMYGKSKQWPLHYHEALRLSNPALQALALWLAWSRASVWQCNLSLSAHKGRLTTNHVVSNKAPNTSTSFSPVIGNLWARNSSHLHQHKFWLTPPNTM